MSHEGDGGRREVQTGRRGENGSTRDRRGDEVGEGGREDLAEAVREEEVSGMSRSWFCRTHSSMLAPQNLSHSRDYRTHNAPRPPSRGLQVWRRERVGKVEQKVEREDGWMQEVQGRQDGGKTGGGKAVTSVLST